MADRMGTYKGVSFKTIRAALFNMYFYNPEMTDEEAEAIYNKYVVPMQHNFENPLEGDESKDTFIEYWIFDDDRLSQDYMINDQYGMMNSTMKLVSVDIRFVGVEAEIWAKAFHHITRRPRVAEIFAQLCNAKYLEYIGSIRPMQIDYFGAGNSSIAFDLTIRLEYEEYIDLSFMPLEYVSMAKGDIEIEGGV